MATERQTPITQRGYGGMRTGQLQLFVQIVSFRMLKVAGRVLVAGDP